MIENDRQEEVGRTIRRFTLDGPQITLIGDQLAWCFSLLLLHCRWNDEGELCPKRHGLTLSVIVEAKVFRAVIGRVRSRSFAHPPASPPVQPQEIHRKSLIKRTLPVSLFACRNLDAIGAINPVFSGRGEGVGARQFGLLEAPRDRLTETLSARRAGLRARRTRYRGG